MEILSRLDGKKIVVKIQQNKKYGIMLSGGLDSAMLLYLILLENKFCNIQPYSIPKHDGSHKYVQGILEYFNTEFDIELPKPIIVGNPAVHHSQQSRVAITELFLKYPVDYLFIGLNQNPPQPWGDPNWERPNRLLKSPSDRIILPFIELYKTHIVDLIFQFDQKYLVNLTHTCTEQPVGRCNQCFQCNERSWAFEQLVQTDTGIL
jgi:hypothetical protein